MAKITKEDALRYHTEGRPGKLEVIPTKPHTTQRDLSLAYSPGVAYPCLEINKNFDDIYRYTSKGNLVAVIAMVSYSNFGSVKSSEHTRTLDRVRQTTAFLHKDHPELIVDGEIQMNFALNKELRSQKFPFTLLENRDVNTIIFPNLTSGNIAYKMMQEIGGT
jgi:hypothetical protein